jgi:hypothetical protein
MNISIYSNILTALNVTDKTYYVNFFLLLDRSFEGRTKESQWRLKYKRHWLALIIYCSFSFGAARKKRRRSVRKKKAYALFLQS